jgi:hypothetical protein
MAPVPNIVPAENDGKIKNNLRSTSWIPTVFDMPARDQFVGAWVLKSYHVDDASAGVRNYPFGQDAHGLIVSLLFFSCMLRVCFSRRQRGRTTLIAVQFYLYRGQTEGVRGPLSQAWVSNFSLLVIVHVL